jgi:hypothetical protein
MSEHEVAEGGGGDLNSNSGGEILVARRSTRARKPVLVPTPRLEDEDDEQDEEAPSRSPSRKKRSLASSSSSSSNKELSGKLLSELISEGYVQGAKRLLAEPGCKAATLLAWPATCSPQTFFQCLCKWYGFVKGSQRLTFRLDTDTSDKAETLYVQNKDTLVRNIVTTIANALSVDACNLIISTGKSTQRIWDGRLLKAGGDDEAAGGGRSLDDLAQLNCKLRTSARRCDTLLISVVRQNANGSGQPVITEEGVPPLLLTSLSSSSASAAAPSAVIEGQGDDEEEGREEEGDEAHADPVISNEMASMDDVSPIINPSFSSSSSSSSADATTTSSSTLQDSKTKTSMELFAYVEDGIIIASVDDEALKELETLSNIDTVEEGLPSSIGCRWPVGYPIDADTFKDVLKERGSAEAVISNGGSIEVLGVEGETSAASLTSTANVTVPSSVSLVFKPRFEGQISKDVAKLYALLRKQSTLSSSASASSSASSSSALTSSTTVWEIVPNVPPPTVSSSPNEGRKKGASEITFIIPKEEAREGIYSVGVLGQWIDERACAMCRDSSQVNKCKSCGCAVCGLTSEATFSRKDKGEPVVYCDSCGDMVHIGCNDRLRWRVIHSQTGEDLAMYDQPPPTKIMTHAEVPERCKLRDSTSEQNTVLPDGVTESSSSSSSSPTRSRTSSSPLRALRVTSASSSASAAVTFKSRKMTFSEHYVYCESSMSPQCSFFCGKCDVQQPPKTPTSGSKKGEKSDLSTSPPRSSMKRRRLSGGEAVATADAEEEDPATISARKRGLVGNGELTGGGGNATSAVDNLECKPKKDTPGKLSYVNVGSLMINRADASGAGVHFPIVAGMAGTPYGTSFVHLGSYGGLDKGDSLTYLGHGGADLKKNIDGSKANKRTDKRSNYNKDQEDKMQNKSFGASADRYARGVRNEPLRCLRGWQWDKVSERAEENKIDCDTLSHKLPWYNSSSASTASSASSSSSLPYDDGRDPFWLSSYPRSLPWGQAIGKMYLLRMKHLQCFPFLPIGAPGIYRYDGLYHCVKREFKQAPWDIDASSGKSKGLNAFYFTMIRLSNKEDPDQISAPWTAAGQKRERCSLAVLEAVVRTRVRTVAPLDLFAKECGVPCPSAEEDKYFLHWVRMTGGQTDEAFGIWWDGDLSAARSYARAKARGDAGVEDPVIPEDKELIRLIAADVANKRTWDALLKRGVARRSTPRSVNSSAVNMVLEEFQCVILGTGDVSDETVTTPCGHNFDRESLVYFLRGREDSGLDATCVSCNAKLSDDWKNNDLKGKINKACVAAVKAISGC